jgi:hypothetical protein
MTRKSKTPAKLKHPSKRKPLEPPIEIDYSALEKHFAAPEKLFDWRKHLPVHPACELLPPVSEDELKALAEDIKANGLIEPIVVFVEADDRKVLLDGRNRLDALALAGLLKINGDGNLELVDTAGRTARVHYWLERDRDPYALALSYNVHRRHLTTEQKRDLGPVQEFLNRGTGRGFPV